MTKMYHSHYLTADHIIMRATHWNLKWGSENFFFAADDNVP